jgi:PAS domain S-box-containing protein
MQFCELMQPPSIPQNEQLRIAALCNLEILDTPSEERFDRLTRIAKQHFDVPIALVSLVDHDRQWFKSRQGLEATETPRNISFCGHAILHSDIFYIPNTLEDPRFADNPLVTGPPDIRFYAGAPLYSENHQRLGTLCIIDNKPREFSQAQLATLRDLADAVGAELRQVNLIKLSQQLSESEHRLRLKNERLALATESGNIGVWDYNIETNELNWDERMFQLYGVSREQFAGCYEAWSYALHPDDKLQAEKDLAEAITGIKPFDSEFRVIWSNNSIRYLKAAAIVIRDEEGRGIRMTGINQDITERKEMERLKSEFISTVSHELRTPLTSIRGALGLVMGKASEQLAPKLQKMLELASRNAERLTLLINDLLDLEKIESGTLAFEFKTVDLIKLTKSAIEDNTGFADKHGINLLFNTTLDVAHIYGDEHRLLQVYANLISNAVKFSPLKATVTITVESKDHQFIASVKDMGPGIPEEFRNKIFQRFAQADSSDSREKGGTGLGLNITQAIIKRHGGSIDFTSEKGKGACFYFSIAESNTIASADFSCDSDASVLICEDNLDVAQILEEMITLEGVSCDIATSAEQARQLLQQKTYRLLLLDLNLPDCNGIELITELRTNEVTSNLPIVIVSGRALEGKQEFAGDSMMVIDWLQKPIDPTRLQQALNLGLSQSERPRVLHIEDDNDIIQITRDLIEDFTEFSYATTLATARQMLAEQSFDLVILDLTLTDGAGADLLVDIKSKCPVIIFSACNAEQISIANVKATLTKSVTSNTQLRDTIIKVLRSETKEAL